MFKVLAHAVRKIYNKHLIVKLSPNVTSIAEIAKAVESAGADSVSMINTVLGMAIDAEKRKPLLSTITAGLSGPAIKPIGLRCVYQTSKAVKIPIIGLGGITNATDAIEYMRRKVNFDEFFIYNQVLPSNLVFRFFLFGYLTNEIFCCIIYRHTNMGVQWFRRGF